MSKIIKFKFDPHAKRTLTKEQIAELQELELMKDEDIDYSDIPPLDENFWRNAKPINRPKLVKKHISARIDPDIIEWLKIKGKENGIGYQTLLNNIARKAMMEDLATL